MLFEHLLWWARVLCIFRHWFITSSDLLMGIALKLRVSFLRIWQGDDSWMKRPWDFKFSSSGSELQLCHCQLHNLTYHLTSLSHDFLIYKLWKVLWSVLQDHVNIKVTQVILEKYTCLIPSRRFCRTDKNPAHQEFLNFMWVILMAEN